MDFTAATGKASPKRRAQRAASGGLAMLGPANRLRKTAVPLRARKILQFPRFWSGKKFLKLAD